MIKSLTGLVPHPLPPQLPLHIRLPAAPVKPPTTTLLTHRKYTELGCSQSCMANFSLVAATASFREKQFRWLPHLWLMGKQIFQPCIYIILCLYSTWVMIPLKYEGVMYGTNIRIFCRMNGMIVSHSCSYSTLCNMSSQLETHSADCARLIHACIFLYCSNKRKCRSMSWHDSG